MSSDLTFILLLVFLATGLALLVTLLLMRKTLHRKVDGLYFESSQGPIFYKIYGSKGPYVLLIHGLGASSYTWREIAPALAKQYRVISFDLWGFGHSSKSLNSPMNLDSQTEVIQSLLNELHVQEYHVVGHSMGGQLALWLAMNDERVNKCIAIAPAAHPDLISGFLKKLTWIANLTPLLLNAGSIRSLLLRLMNNPSFVTEEIVDSYYAPYQNPKAHLCFAAALEIIRDKRVFTQLPQFKRDLTFIWGADDNVISAKMAQEIEEQTFMARTVTHPKSGHLPMEDDPSWLVEQIFIHLKP